MNRRLIRPNLAEIKEKIKSDEANKPLPPPPPQPVHQPHPHQPPMSSQHSQHSLHSQQQQQKKMHPPTDTSAETYYYLKQMSKKTPMAVVFNDGEVIEGYIEWYDRSCIKLNRDNAPNLLVYKNNIKYMYKLNESKENPEGEPDERK